jgi:hypothetical protein
LCRYPFVHKHSTIMIKNFLLPHSLKKWGWVLFLPTFALILWSLGLRISANYLTEGWVLNQKWDVFGDSHPLSLWTKIPMRDGSDDILGEILMTLAALGFLLILFTQEKKEDEFISHLRLRSLLWTFLGQIVFFLLGVWLVYGLSFVDWMGLNLALGPLLFLGRYHWLLHDNGYFGRQKGVLFL